jgi:hypothetical protein
VFTPLEVRYLYALTFPLAAAAGLGWDALMRRGGGWAALACGLLALQVVQGAATIGEAVLSRYRV